MFWKISHGFYGFREIMHVLNIIDRLEIEIKVSQICNFGAHYKKYFSFSIN